jgi:FkbM family methyltransferase
LRQLGRLIPNIDLVVDIGANQGQFSSAIAHRYRQARIICFEPDPAAFQIIERRLSTSQFILNNSAIGGSCEDRIFYSCSRSHISSFYTAASGNREIGYQGFDWKRIVVEQQTLQAALAGIKRSGVSLLKIDAQGAELEILGASEEELIKFQYILLEVPFVQLYEGQALFVEVLDELARRGFALMEVLDFCYGDGGAIIECDVLFERKTDSATVR